MQVVVIHQQDTDPNMINGDYDPSFFFRFINEDLNLANEIIKLQKLKITNDLTSRKKYNKVNLKNAGQNSNHLKVIKLLEQNNKLTFQRRGR